MLLIVSKSEFQTTWYKTFANYIWILERIIVGLDARNECALKTSPFRQQHKSLIIYHNVGGICVYVKVF